MKLFVKLIFAALFIAVLLPFTLLKGTDGRPLMSIGDLKMPDLGISDLSLPEAAKDAKVPGLSGIGSANQDIVYQWRDAAGSLHFTTQPPPEGTEYTVKGYDPRTNLIQSVKIEEEPEPEDSDSEQNDGAQVKEASDVGNPYSPEKVEKLFKDAKNVEKLLNDRLKQQEAMIGQ